MAAWRYEISLLVLKKCFTRSLRSLRSSLFAALKYFSTLEEKFRISARPCNILYIRPESDVGFCPCYKGLFFSVYGSFFTSPRKTSFRNFSFVRNGRRRPTTQDVLTMGFNLI